MKKSYLSYKNDEWERYHQACYRLGSKRISPIILMRDYETLDLGDVKLLSGKNLKSAKITYRTYGTLNKNSDNVIVLPTFYTGTHKRNEGFFWIR